MRYIKLFVEIHGKLVHAVFRFGTGKKTVPASFYNKSSAHLPIWRFPYILELFITRGFDDFDGLEQGLHVIVIQANHEGSFISRSVADVKRTNNFSLIIR